MNSSVNQPDYKWHHWGVIFAGVSAVLALLTFVGYDLARDAPRSEAGSPPTTSTPAADGNDEGIDPTTPNSPDATPDDSEGQPSTSSTSSATTTTTTAAGTETTDPDVVTIRPPTTGEPASEAVDLFTLDAENIDPCAENAWRRGVIESAGSTVSGAVVCVFDESGNLGSFEYRLNRRYSTLLLGFAIDEGANMDGAQSPLGSSVIVGFQQLRNGAWVCVPAPVGFGCLGSTVFYGQPAAVEFDVSNIIALRIDVRASFPGSTPLLFGFTESELRSD